MQSRAGTEKVVIHSLVALAVKCSLRSLRAKSRRRLFTPVSICAMRRNMTKGREPRITLSWGSSHALWKCCGKVVERLERLEGELTDAKAEVQLRLSLYWRCGGIKSYQTKSQCGCPVWTQNLCMWRRGTQPCTTTLLFGFARVVWCCLCRNKAHRWPVALQ